MTGDFAFVHDGPLYPAAYLFFVNIFAFGMFTNYLDTVFMFFLMPILIATGVLLWDLDRFASFIDAVGGIKAVSAAHLLVTICFVAFLFVHVYLTTLGRTPLEHIKAMFTGYEEEPEQGH